jgi:hypothetical protein
MSGGSCNPLGVVIETRSMFNSCWSIHHAVYSPADYPDLSFKQFFGRATSICPGLVCGRCQYTNLAGIYAGNGNENAISWLNCPIVHSDSGELTILCFTFQFVKCDAPEGQVLPFSTSSQIFFSGAVNALLSNASFSNRSEDTVFFLSTIGWMHLLLCPV